jgi:hypothetical protein
MSNALSFLRPTTFPGELVPSQLGLNIVESHFTLDDIMRLVQSGSHNLNPYHNTIHELQHVYWSHACAVNSNGPDEDHFIAEHLALASLFHDHNHSGGTRLDPVNIERALEFIKVHFPFVDARFESLIKVTEFVNGKWPQEPESFEEKCMRDADLMSIYTREGRRLLIGLFEELGAGLTHDLKKDEVVKLLCKNAEFLWGSEMFTSFGKQMKADHLERSLKDFERQVWSRYRYEVSGRPDVDD